VDQERSIPDLRSSILVGPLFIDVEESAFSNAIVQNPSASDKR
jgi:hypothetical protein